MQEAIAKTKYVRISPRKARLAADLIRGKGVEEALLQLLYCNLKGGRLLKKTLDSAIANAETLHSVQRRDLKVKEVRVDVGPTLKRAKSKSRGGKVPILKRMSHFTIIVGTEG
ncbi:50S ribosomal protein L22 [Candidatus Neptunochlamydia vexilliferae]|uniref:50S ribosomal protein L22 n=1 Tax=Candidatus Neptunichlamydia vexilliferae TaxID=1651774 RepID=UPI001890EDB8|nr:50S ribosomal protein L22 [Candidatus Neptunochlamydia vexilliferae]